VVDTALHGTGCTLSNVVLNAARLNWLVPDHLGTPRIILDQTGAFANVKRHDYLPFGEELPAGTGGRTAAMGYVAGDGIRQQFTSKERDVETGLDYFGIRYYSALQGRFSSIDPLLLTAKGSKPQTWNRYAYVLNNPLRLIDIDGAAPQEPSAKPKGSAGVNSSDAPTLSVGVLLVRHPSIAIQIGDGNERFSISAAAIRFSSRVGLMDGPGSLGTQVNAVRHVTWQSIITARFGSDIATQAGNAHERNPNVDLSVTTFTGKNALASADQTADLLNNRIGRQIGAANPTGTNRDLARLTLDYFHTNGLFVATPGSNGSVNVVQTTLTDEQYAQANAALQTLTNWGERSAEAAVRNIAEREAQERAIRRIERHDD
jgi:RHS repeat-associated protein